MTLRSRVTDVGYQPSGRDGEFRNFERARNISRRLLNSDQYFPSPPRSGTISPVRNCNGNRPPSPSPARGRSSRGATGLYASCASSARSRKKASSGINGIDRPLGEKEGRSLRPFVVVNRTHVFGAGPRCVQKTALG